MPAGFAHTLFGIRVFQTLPDPLKESIRRHRDLYLAGLQGPDILFYYHPLKANAVSRLGKAMHEKSGKRWFSDACQMEEGEDYEARRVYLYGVVCHFTLDAMCHDYIDSYAETSFISHYEIEGEFDRSLLVKEKKDPLSYSRIPGFPSDAYTSEIIRVFYPGLSAETVREALESFVKFHQLLLCPTDHKRNFIYSALRVLGKYQTLKGHIINKKANLSCASSNQELTRRFEEAIPKAASLILGFSKVLSKEESLEDWAKDPLLEKNFVGRSLVLK